MRDKVLVYLVEDHPMVRHTNTLLLQMEGFEVVAQETAEKALAEIPEVGPDLLVIDISLPGMSGLELLRALPKPLPPSLVLTGHDADQYREEADASGASLFLSKHEGAKALVSAVTELAKSLPDC